MEDWQLHVIEEAKRWLGARWQHAARVRYSTVDCAQFLIDVFAQAGLIEDFSYTHYPRQWALHNNAELFLQIIERYAYRIEHAPSPADIVVFHHGKTYSHGGIVVDWPTIIHADSVEGVVYADASVGRLSIRRRVFYHVRGK
jgi:cell wall-associated NlpC family hydrolase